uniref:WD repeat-containing protein 49-like n=1 Tax=Saccoglossus kowalevskii TaxID=10224 RepID=A0ABM0M429_SACKO|nr:PREDICTED: WD repeat-containing protein 49-like [Saccoglossus kowalevskii]
MAFDSGLRRLISGARNGSIKVWNFQNGHNIHQCEAVAEAEVTGIVSFREKRSMLSVGWSRKIVVYDDTDGDNAFIKADISWRGGQVHKDDILSVDYCSPNLLATASFDGEIIVWSVETEKMFKRLRRGQPSKMTRKLKQALSHLEGGSRPATGSSTQGSRPLSRFSSMNSRPNSRHRQQHKPPKGFTAPVDKLLFLQHRVTQGQTDSAVLISSEAGYLHFWSVYGSQQDMGFFYASDCKDEEESVLALCTNKDNSVLISGDTKGYIYIWNIEQYCIQPAEETKRERPPLLCSWRAHEKAVVSVDYIIYDEQSFILSASTDQTARLWTLKGHFVGTFGQDDKWILKNPSTWQHPRTPWGYADEGGVVASIVVPDIVENGMKSDAENLPNNSEGNEKDDSSMSSSSPIQKEDTTKHPVTKFNGRRQSPDRISSPSLSPRDERPISADIKRIQIQSAPNLVNGTENRNGSGNSQRAKFFTNDEYSWRSKRSVTFANFGQPRRSIHMKSLLGHRVEEDIARRTYSRQERRHKFGDVDMTLTSRFGKICSPFQALATPQTEEVRFPYNLPMTPRMVSRGLTITTESELNEFALTPPPGTPEEKKEPYLLLPTIPGSR